MLAPNETYDSIAGTKPGEACAIRDGPYATPEIGKKFGFTEPREHNMNMPFVEKWTSILREYSVRCGEETDFVKIPKSQFVGKAQSHILHRSESLPTATPETAG